MIKIISGSNMIAGFQNGDVVKVIDENTVHILSETNVKRYPCGCVAYQDSEDDDNGIFFCNDAQKLDLDIINAQKKFKYSPTIENEDRLLLAVQSYKKHFEKGKVGTHGK